MIKTVHLADVHFDSPLAMLDISRAEMRRREILESFSELIKYIKGERINLLLIAGDLFDRDYVSRETAETLREEFASLENCRVVIAPGNHDPYDETSIYAKVKFSENVHIFKSSEVTSFDFPEINCTVYGYAFTSPHMETNPALNVSPVNPERINILLAHGDMLSPISRYCPITAGDIERGSFDYTALGHIHNSDGVHTTRAGKYYAYSGCFEGRGFDETGRKGVIAARMEKEAGKLSFDAKFVYFSKRMYVSSRLDVTGCESQAQIAERINSYIAKEGFGENTALKIILEGNVDPMMKIFPERIREQIGGLFTLSVQDETLPLYECGYLESDPSIRGAFYDRIKPLLESSDPEERKTAALALRYGLTALAGGDPVDFM